MLAAALVGGCASEAAGLPGFPTEEIVVSGDTWAVAVADEPAERAQGLMGVADLGGLRGMLFVFPSDTEAAFWMKDTILALDVAFFRADGSLVDVLTMAPCPADPCPTYQPAGSYRFALEVPAGGFAGTRDLRLDPASVPAGG